METEGRGSLPEHDSQTAGSLESESDTTDSKAKKKSKKTTGQALPWLLQEEAPKTETKPVETEPKKDLLDLFRTKESEPQENIESLASVDDAEQFLDELDDPLEPLAADANPEELSEPERQAIIQQLIAARRQELGEELHAAPDDQEEEILTNAAFVDNLEELVAQSGELNDEVLDDATQATMDEFELPAPATATEQTEPKDNEPEDTDTAQPLSALRPIVPPAALPPSARPTPIIPPRSERPDNTPPDDGDVMPPTPDVVVSLATPNVIMPVPRTPELRVDRASGAADMLVGGIIGYLVGRRRGRIRAEKRLMPIQRKLEREVKDMKEKITVREEKIRTLTNQKIAVEGAPARQAVMQKMEVKARSSEKTPNSKVAPAAEAKTEAPAPLTVIAPEVKTKIEAGLPLVSSPEVLPFKPPRPERIGAVLLPRAEVARSLPTASPIESAPVPTPVITRESVRTMPEPELLQIAAKLEVAGTTVKTLHEQGKISQETMRVVVAEYASGRNYEKPLLEKLRIASPESTEVISQSVDRLPGAHKDVGGVTGSAAPVPVPGPATSDDKLRPVSLDPRLLAGSSVSPAQTPTRSPISRTTWVGAGMVIFVAVVTAVVLVLFF